MSTVVQINASQALQDAIRAITDEAHEDSLLRDPFNSELDTSAFVSPLTENELALLVQWRLERTDRQQDLDDILEFRLDGDIAASRTANVVWLEDRIRYLTENIDALVEKEELAHIAYANAIATQLAGQEVNREAGFQELSALIDKFEVFKTVGFYGLNKWVKPEFERILRNFIEGAPEILFISEYVIDGEFIGALLCLELYPLASHYEILKRNVFQSDSEFERILILGRADMQEETSNFMPYVQKVLGFTDLVEKNVFLVLDTSIRRDRIYEYAIVAGSVPTNFSFVDYDLIMQSRNLLTARDLSTSANYTLAQYAMATLGNQDFAWILALVNEGITLFGRTPSERSLASIVADPEFTSPGTIRIDVPKSMEDALKIVRESMSLLGTPSMFRHFLKVMGGLPLEICDAAVSSIDESRNVFVYELFRSQMKDKAPVFQLVSEIAETRDADALEELSGLSVSVPANVGSESFTTILGLSDIVKFINDTTLAISYAQDPGTFQKLKQIRALIAINRGEEDTLESASEESRNVVASQTTNTEDVVVSNYNVLVGQTVNSDQEAQSTLQNNSMAILPK